jgi:hypothetical protein
VIDAIKLTADNKDRHLLAQPNQIYTAPAPAAAIATTLRAANSQQTLLVPVVGVGGAARRLADGLDPGSSGRDAGCDAGLGGR